MMRQISGEDARQRLIRTKLDFMRWSVNERYLACIGENRQQWVRRFQNSAIGEAWGLDLSAATLASVTATVARKLNGGRIIRRADLLALATHTTLVTATRDPLTAAYMLTDDCSFEDFRTELIASSWADAEAAVRGRAMSRHLLLEAFGPFGLRRGGLRMGDDATLAAAPPAETRGMRVPRLEDQEDLQNIPLETLVGLLIDDLPAPRGLLLLEIGSTPDPDGAFPVTSLVPSMLAPDCRVEPGQLLPTESVHDIDRFVADGPPGTYDWLAILTREPLSPTWTRRPAQMHRLSPQDLDWLLGALSRETRDPEAAGALEVRHHPFTIGGSAR